MLVSTVFILCDFEVVVSEASKWSTSRDPRGMVSGLSLALTRSGQILTDLWPVRGLIDARHLVLERRSALTVWHWSWPSIFLFAFLWKIIVYTWKNGCFVRYKRKKDTHIDQLFKLCFGYTEKCPIYSEESQSTFNCPAYILTFFSFASQDQTNADFGADLRVYRSYNDLFA